MLLNSGADVNAAGKKTVLSVAVEYQATPVILGLLLAAGANPAACDPPLTKKQCIAAAEALEDFSMKAEQPYDHLDEHRWHLHMGDPVPRKEKSTKLNTSAILPVF